MSTVFVMAGSFGLSSFLPWMLGGQTEQSDGQNNTIETVYYWNWTTSPQDGGLWGAQALDPMLNATPGQKIVLGYGLGAVAAARWLHDYGPTSTISPVDLSFVLIGNWVRQYGGKFYDPSLAVPPATPYTVTDVARQYDGWCDWPNNLTAGTDSDQILAVNNAIQGQQTSHDDYFAPSVAADNLTLVEGNITFVLLPTQWVPVVQWLWWLGAPTLNYEDSVYRPQIEACYDRTGFTGQLPPPGVALSPLPPLTQNLATADRRDYDGVE